VQVLTDPRPATSSYPLLSLFQSIVKLSEHSFIRLSQMVHSGKHECICKCMRSSVLHGRICR